MHSVPSALSDESSEETSEDDETRHWPFLRPSVGQVGTKVLDAISLAWHSRRWFRICVFSSFTWEDFSLTDLSFELDP